MESDSESHSGAAETAQAAAPAQQTMLEHHDLLNNETIANDKHTNRQRICIVGEVAENQELVVAARTFNVPVMTSETGAEFLDDDTWTTYFVLAEFEGTIFDVISKAKVKHKILGPQALITASTSSKGLPSHSRPIFNYSMKGIVAAFSGIRKRDELTYLVRLIHFMGGSIRKDLNDKATHLICPNAFGDKYRYALTFRLNVVRSSWVHDAWRNKNDAGFSAKSENFTSEHRLKIFEGCRIAFIGFPDHEKTNMVSLLRSYNGIETPTDDDSCTHKVIADCPVFANEPNNATFDGSMAFNEEDLDNEDDEGDDYACQVIQRKHDSFLRHFDQRDKDCTDLPIVMEEDETAKSAQLEKSDGVVLLKEEDAFSTAHNISPILKTIPGELKEEDYDAFPNESVNEDGFREAFKRKRSPDDTLNQTDLSLMSMDSTKKPKLTRAGSLTKNLRRRMSFGVIQPINNLFRRSNADPNLSNCSAFETTFNESIKEPIKEKYRQIKDKFKKKDLSTPKSAKAKMRMASANLTSMKDVCTIKTNTDILKTPPADLGAIEFKTPKALPASSSKSFKPRPKPDEPSNAAADTVDNKLVVEESSLRYDHGCEDPKYYIVKAEWFWTRIAEGYAPEDDFLYKDYMQSVRDEQAEQCERRDSLINYSSAKAQRKRKRLSRIVLEGTPASAGKRRSSISDAGLLSESLIDYTASPDKNDSVKSREDLISSAKKFSMRHNHFMDFFHTETNYVGILKTIVEFFKEPLEKIAKESPDQSDLLNKSELSLIFSNFLPIYQVHVKMLNTLKEINSSWKEEAAIGQIILENSDALLKAYPSYVNDFELMKATLVQSAQTKPRFQAFLKMNQAKPECGRQSLQELMIRPVQRLPSISLLLNDILKHTPKTNRDHADLVEALEKIKEVMTHINEDKRKTEGQKQMFNIFNEIENCPPHLISSHRSFISRCEVTELSETLSGRGDSLLLFLFTDTLEICKKRSRYNNSKSPNSTRGTSAAKPYKHIKLIPLSSIRTLADISDSPRAFAVSLRCSSNIQDTSKDKLYSFSISDEEVDKTIYIKSFCKQLAENACRTDAEKFVVGVQSQEVGIDIHDVNLGTLSKAFRLATRTRLKVGRAFSFSKTPSRKRNIASPFGSNASLTPSTISSMSHLKLQSSCMTLNEFDMDRKESQDQHHLMAPLTDQMVRKNKKTAGSEDV